MDVASEKTEQLRRLLVVPEAERDEEWLSRLLFVAPDAVLHLTSEQTVIGPDGFPYIVLEVPVENERFVPTTIRDLSRHAVTMPFGVVINYPARTMAWVFKYGDIWDLFERGAICSNFGFQESKSIHGYFREEVQEIREVQVYQPDEKDLPSYVRVELRKFVTDNLGLEREVSIVVLNDPFFEPAKSIVFSIYEEDFASCENYRAALGALSWFFPMRIGIVSCADLEPAMKRL